MNGCRASRTDLCESSGGKTEEKPLLVPVVREALAHLQKPCGRQLDGLATLKDGAHDVWRNIGEPHKGAEAAPSDPAPFDHRLDAVVGSGQQLVADHERFGD